MATCPAGCREPICYWNEDPPGEDAVIARQKQSKYGERRVCLILLERLERPSGDGDLLPEGERQRRHEFHRTLDKLMVESKRLWKAGDRAGLVTYGQEFRGLFVWWVPYKAELPPGLDSLRAAPVWRHHIVVRGVRPARGSGETRAADVWEIRETDMVSGYTVRSRLDPHSQTGRGQTPYGPMWNKGRWGDFTGK